MASYNTVSLQKFDNTSWIIGFIGGSASSLCTPSGMSTVASAGIVRGSDTNAAVKAWSTQTCSVISETWMTETVEIISAPPLTIGAREAAYTNTQWKAKGLSYWPDGTAGIVDNGGGSYTYYIANGSSIARMTGTVTDIAATVNDCCIQIAGMKNSYNYTAGGPIYKDTTTGYLYMLYHAEMWDPPTDPTAFWSLLGMAKSTNNGVNWTDLGEIIRPNSQFKAGNHEITGGSFVQNGEYLYVYFRDLLTTGVPVELAVARTRIVDIIAAADTGNVTAFTKYYAGSFSQPALNGLSSPILSPGWTSNFVSVSYNSYRQRYIMVITKIVLGDNWDLLLYESIDGISWQFIENIETGSTESYAPSIIPASGNSWRSCKDFYVYYSESAAGGFDRWTDSVTSRRLVTWAGPDLDCGFDEGTDVTPPTVPTDLNVAATGATQIQLQWTPSNDAVAVTDYKIERCQGSGCSGFVQVATSIDNIHDDTVSPLTLYRYRVRASDAAGNLSGYSNIDDATTPAGASRPTKDSITTTETSNRSSTKSPRPMASTSR